MNVISTVSVLLAVTACSYGQAIKQEVAFSAALTHHVNLTGSQNVIYNEVITNVGAAYDVTTGFFKCPTSGIYVFQVEALSRSDRTVYLQLHHNSRYVVSVWAHTSGGYAAGGNSAVLKLTRGDTVCVQSVDGHSTALFGDPQQVYCTFSGYMIAEVFEDIPVVGK